MFFFLNCFIIFGFYVNLMTGSNKKGHSFFASEGNLQYVIILWPGLYLQGSELKLMS